MPKLPIFTKGGVSTESLTLCAVGHVCGFRNADRCYRPIAPMMACGAPIIHLAKNPKLARIWFYGRRGSQLRGDLATMAEIWWEFPHLVTLGLLGGEEAMDEMLVEWGVLPYGTPLKRLDH